MKKLILLICMIGIFYSGNAQDKPADKPAGKVSGQVFFDYYHNVGRDTGLASMKNTVLKGNKDQYGFMARRVYFTYDFFLSEKIGGRFRLEADENALAAGNGAIIPFIKDAYLEWNDIFYGSKLIVGIQPTIAYEVSESVFGFRSLDKTQLDLRGVISSRDVGVTLKGKIDGEGVINYAIQYGNNSHVKPETDKFKRLSGLFYVKPYKNVHLTVYGEQVWKAADNDAMLYSFSAGYMEKDEYAFGMESYLQMTNKDYTQKDKKEKSTRSQLGFSVYGHYYFMPEMGLMARFDMFDPNLDADFKGDSRNYILAGLVWKAAKNLQIIPNIQMETFEKVESETGDKEYDPSMTARITLVYNY